MTNEEMLESLLKENERINQTEVINPTEQMREIYSNDENLTTHASPDLEKYYYAKNPNIDFTGTGILKDSPAGHTLHQLINRRSNGIATIHKLNTLRTSIIQNQTMDFSNLTPALFSLGTVEIISSIYNHFMKSDIPVPNFRFYDPDHDLEAMSPEEQKKHFQKMREM